MIILLVRKLESMLVVGMLEEREARTDSAVDFNHGVGSLDDIAESVLYSS